jgi:hypothetical protein
VNKSSVILVGLIAITSLVSELRASELTQEPEAPESISNIFWGYDNIQKGRFFIAGHLSFNYEMTEKKNPPQHKFTIISDMSAGYFFWNHLAIGAGLPIKMTLVPARKGLFGLSFFGTYFFKFNNLIYPYAGLDLTPAYSVNEQALKLSAGIHAGALISLSPHLALDFGCAPELYFPLNKQQRYKLELPIGFVGLRAFF